MLEPEQIFFLVPAAAAIVLLAAVLWSLKRYGRIPLLHKQLSSRSKLVLFAGALFLVVVLPLLKVLFLYR